MGGTAMSATKLSLQRPLTPREALSAAISSFNRRCEAKNLSPHTLAIRVLTSVLHINKQGIAESCGTYWRNEIGAI
jgi:hypothetical protein